MDEAFPVVTIERGRSLAEQTREQLRAMIISGALPPDVVFSEYELARRLSISRSPLREAIHQLQDEGLLNPTGPRGFTVPAVTREFVENIYDVREALETMAASTARMPSRDEIDTARRRLSEARRALDDGVGDVFTATDFAFHDLYVRHCGNEPLITMIGRLASHISRVQVIANPLTSHIEESYAEHVVILDALEAGDTEALVEAVRAHIRGVKSRLSPSIGA